MSTNSEPISIINLPENGICFQCKKDLFVQSISLIEESINRSISNSNADFYAIIPEGTHVEPLFLKLRSILMSPHSARMIYVKMPVVLCAFTKEVWQSISGFTGMNSDSYEGVIAEFVAKLEEQRKIISLEIEEVLFV